MNRNLLKVYPFVFFLLCTVLVWRVISLGVSEFLSADSSVDNIDAILSWNSVNPQALLAKGLSHLSTDKDSFEFYLAKSIVSNISDSRSLVLLAERWAERGDIERANKAMHLLVKLYPADISVGLAAASYFYSRSKLTEAFQHWSQAMLRSSRFDSVIFDFIYPQLKHKEMRDAVINASRAGKNGGLDFLLTRSSKTIILIL